MLTIGGKTMNVIRIFARGPLSRISVVFVVLSLLILGYAQEALAGPFGVIYGSQMSATLCSGCGITSGLFGFALLANTGTSNITAADMNTIAFSVTSSHSGFTFTPFHWSSFSGPLLPGQVVGGVYGTINGVLTTQLESGETLINTGDQFLGFGIDRAWGNTWEGTVVFDVLMTMSGNQASFQVSADMKYGPHSVIFTDASRVSSSVPEPSLILLIGIGFGAVCLVGWRFKS
jgi:hypothetical protein